MIKPFLHCLSWLSVAALLLAGCAAPAPERERTPRPEDAPPQIELDAEVESPSALLRRARRADPDTATDLRLQAARLLAQRQSWQEAAELLSAIDADALSESRRARHELVAAALALNDGAAERALGLLAEADRLESRADRLLASRVKAEALASLGRPVAAIRARLQMQSLLDADAAQRENNLVWELVLTVPEPAQRAAAPDLDNAILQGWLELAAIARSHYPTLEQQQEALIEWERRQPQHPAVEALPQALAEIPVAISEQPRQVALLLPLSGPLGSAGQAILNGYMASHFQALAHGGFSPSVRVHDTAREDSLQAYQRAVDGGAQLVIGPLERDGVQALAREPSLPTPVLALNATAGLHTGSQLIQFGLLPEDEGEQLARGLYREGHRRVLLLSSDSGWSDRLLRSFRDRFEQLGGEVVTHQRFATTREIGDGVAAGLLIGDSHERAREMRRVLATNLEFEPRRRQDLDAVVLAAEAAIARSVKPTLAYHFAGDLPIYASSHIYQGTVEQRVTSELDGIRFLGMPWRLNPWSVRHEVEDAWSGTDGSSAAFYAMGADAWQLQARLPLLFVEHGFHAGATGELRLGADGRLQRELSWALLRQGRPVQVDWLKTPLVARPR